MPAWLNTIIVVVVTAILLRVIIAPLRKINDWVASLIPEGRFKDIVSKSHAERHKPTLDSLRRGLK